MARVPGTAGYADEAPVLFKRYEGRDFAQVHEPILNLLSPAPARVLDIGAGTGLALRMIVAVMILGEAFTIWHALGTALVIGGSVWFARTERRVRQAAV